MKRCNNCGNMAEDDASYCSICGVKLDEEQVYNHTISNNKKSGGFLKSLLMVIIVSFSFLFIRSCIIGKSSDNIPNGVTERNLTSNDYSVSTSEGLTSVTITITAKRDIKQCNVAVTVHDKSGNAIYSDTITKTGLIKNNSYSYKFDYGFLNALSGSTYTTEITGKVSLI